jgi:hypothetical protein
VHKKETLSHLPFLCFVCWEIHSILIITLFAPLIEKIDDPHSGAQPIERSFVNPKQRTSQHSIDTMKLSAVIALISAAVVLASPAAVSQKSCCMRTCGANHDLQVSLDRSVKEVRGDDGVVTTLSCVECPCGGFDGDCKCVSYFDGVNEI